MFSINFKTFKKPIIAFLCLMVLLFSIPVLNIKAETVADGFYKIPVTLMKEHENVASMGNNALLPDAILEVKNGKAMIKLRFVSLKFMGFEGYLGRLEVDGTKVDVVSTYDKIDGYNDPIKGTDKLMKGKKYPKDVQFPIEIGSKEKNVKVYVPVMGELADGNQKARLKFDWPSNFNSVKLKNNKFEDIDQVGGSNDSIQQDNNKTPSKDLSNEIEKNELGYVVSNENTDRIKTLPKLETGEALKLKDGYYKVNVELYNEREDKPSMGNNSMVHEAYIHAENGRYRMYIGSKSMEVSGITASLVSLQILDGDKYYYAKPYAFDLKIPGDDEKRPEVFEFDIKNKSPYMYVMVDPKVKPMGEVPIGARLKIDWSSLKEADKDSIELYKKKENGSKRPEFDSSKGFTKKIDSDVSVDVLPDTFNQYVKFKYDEIFGGRDYLKAIQKIGRDSKSYMFKFKIENEYGMQVSNKKPIKLQMKKKNGISNKINAMYIDDFSPIKVKEKGDKIELELKRAGDICVYSPNANKSTGIVKKITNAISNIVGNNKSNYKPKKSVSRTNIIKPSITSNNSTNKNTSTNTSTNTTTNSQPPQKLESSNTELLETNDNLQDESTKKETKDKEPKRIEKKENNKFIFFAILMMVVMLMLSFYTYIVIGKKLIYEMKLEQKLRTKLGKGAENEK